MVCLCGGISGCATTTVPLTDNDLFTEEDFDLPAQISPAELAALPPGSRVLLLYVTDTSSLRVQGEVLHASPNGVALMNVTRQGWAEHGTPVLSKVPYVNRLFKNTGVGTERLPVHWVPIDLISTAQVVQQPPEGYVAPQLAINTDDSPVFERIGIDFDFNVDETASPRFETPVISDNSAAF
jgi:hypothetical protein